MHPKWNNPQTQKFLNPRPLKHPLLPGHEIFQ
nr:MAG TPA: hypothetical protein [Caudoviricetes sp.]